MTEEKIIIGAVGSAMDDETTRATAALLKLIEKKIKSDKRVKALNAKRVEEGKKPFESITTPAGGQNDEIPFIFDEVLEDNRRGLEIKETNGVFHYSFKGNSEVLTPELQLILNKKIDAENVKRAEEGKELLSSIGEDRKWNAAEHGAIFQNVLKENFDIQKRTVAPGGSVANMVAAVNFIMTMAVKQGLLEQAQADRVEFFQVPPAKKAHGMILIHPDTKVKIMSAFRYTEAVEPTEEQWEQLRNPKNSALFLPNSTPTSYQDLTERVVEAKGKDTGLIITLHGNKFKADIRWLTKIATVLGGNRPETIPPEGKATPETIDVYAKALANFDAQPGTSRFMSDDKYGAYHLVPDVKGKRWYFCPTEEVGEKDIEESTAGGGNCVEAGAVLAATNLLPMTVLGPLSQAAARTIVQVAGTRLDPENQQHIELFEKNYAKILELKARWDFDNRSKLRAVETQMTAQLK